MLLPLLQNNLLTGAGNSQISGTTAGVASTTATLQAKGALSGSSAGVASPTATLQAKGALSGSTAGVATPTAQIRAKGALVGTTAGTASATATLTAKGALSGISAGAASPVATLAGKGALVGTTAGVASTTATLGTVPSPISGTTAGVATTTAVLTAKGALSGTSAGLASTTATLSAKGALVGTSAGLAASTATLSARGALSGTSAGTSTATATLQAKGALSGISAGVASTAATLTGIASTTQRRRSGKLARGVQQISFQAAPVYLDLYCRLSSVLERNVRSDFNQLLLDGFSKVSFAVATVERLRVTQDFSSVSLDTVLCESVRLMHAFGSTVSVEYEKQVSGLFQGTPSAIAVTPPGLACEAIAATVSACTPIEVASLPMSAGPACHRVEESGLCTYENVFNQQPSRFAAHPRSS